MAVQQSYMLNSLCAVVGWGGLGVIIESNLNRVRLSCCWVGVGLGQYLSFFLADIVLTQIFAFYGFFLLNYKDIVCQIAAYYSIFYRLCSISGTPDILNLLNPL